MTTFTFDTRDESGEDAMLEIVTKGLRKQFFSGGYIAADKHSVPLSNIIYTDYGRARIMAAFESGIVISRRWYAKRNKIKARRPKL